MIFAVANCSECHVTMAAFVWSLSSMSPHVNLKIPLFRENFTTVIKGASEGVLAFMLGLFVKLKSRGSCKGFETVVIGALKLKSFFMAVFMMFEVLSKLESFSTVRMSAFEIPCW